jgi:hypothetical protein
VIRTFMPSVARVILAGAILFGLTGIACAADTGNTQDAAAVQAPFKAKHRRAPYLNRECCGEVYRYVYAEAWYGNQKVVAPVRRIGCCDQVQIPGGAWIDCVFSCEITIRKMRLGYWQGLGAGYDNERSPGYPRADFYTNSFGFRSGYMF